MASKKILSPRSWLAFFIIPLFLVACESAAEPTFPLPNGIPKDDIIFMPDGNPVNTNDQGKTLGFINDDGSDHIDYTFKIFGAPLNFGIRFSTQQANYPRWSRSGTMLVFSIASTPPDIRLIDSNGRMYGQNCDALEYASTLDAKGNILGEITKDSSLYPQYQNKISANTSLIARYDLKTCTVVGVFSVPVPQHSGLWNISEAGNGLVTAEFSSDSNKIIILDHTTQAFTLFPGYHPSLSGDGAWLAYYDLYGNLIVRDIKSNVEKTITNIFPAYNLDDPDWLFMPGWSPDNKWLVYNTPDGKIYKVNIETGENIYITYGWAPDWRP
jgi:hypothetical protein